MEGDSPKTNSQSSEEQATAEFSAVVEESPYEKQQREWQERGERENAKLRDEPKDWDQWFNPYYQKG